jgi:hypothetical protein
MIHICSHELNDCKGSWNKLPDHKKPPSEDWKPICERLRAKWNCYEFQHFINGFKKENPRYLSEQLGAVEKFLDEENPKREVMTETIAICCRNWRCKFLPIPGTGTGSGQTYVIPGLSRNPKKHPV